MTRRRRAAMSNRLAKKVCIITGTGGSIGAAAALAFAREGALVVGTDQQAGGSDGAIAAVHDAGGAMVAFAPCDLGEPDDCRALVAFALKIHGRIDVLFNNAAKAYFNRIEDISDEEWASDRRDEVDLVFYLTRAAWPYLKASHGSTRLNNLRWSLRTATRPPSISVTAESAASATAR